MKEYTVVVLDTTGIQPYIFGSNKLRENIGASYLVKQATSDWVREILGGMTTIPVLANLSQQKAIEEGAEIEIIYAGGGNAVLLFQSEEKSIEFTQKLSRKVLVEAPGINLIVARYKKFDWDSQKLHEVISKLMKNELEQQKYKRIPSAPLLGLGVTAFCNSTQLVAVDRSDRRPYGMPKDDDPYLISREIGAKLQAVSHANKDLEDMVNEVLGEGSDLWKKFQGYQFPLRGDQMGRSKEENSYIAVVHADGNRMGKRFREHGKKRSEKHEDNPRLANRAYIEAMRELSDGVDNAGKQALKEVIKVLVNSVREVTENDSTTRKVVGKLGEFEIQDNYLPFRPLVYGGDDITFICDGRLGLELAAIYLRELEKPEMPDDETIKACAGISVVKVHYPFARAYELSEALCKEAKRFVKDKKKSPEDFSALDWHIAGSGLSGSISEIRKREYQVSSGSLTMRPIRLQTYKKEWQNWESFTPVIEEFVIGKDWKGRKNKVLALREVLREGDDAVKQFLQNYKPTKLPSFSPSSAANSKLAREGWLNGICGYFDAIEAMEFCLLLEEEKNGTVSAENRVAE